MKRPNTKPSLMLGMLVVTVALLGYVWVLGNDSSSGSKQDLGHGYSREGDHILFEDRRIDREGRHDIRSFAEAVGHPLVLCHDVDAASFVALSEEYTKDKNRVYYKWISPGRFWVVELPEANPATFVVLDFNLAKDNQHVWKWDAVIEGADAATAEVVNPHWTWKDRHRVYYQSEVLPAADPRTFKHLDQGFYRDASTVFWCTDPLTEADAATFETFGDVPYARDRFRVWSGSKLLPGVDATTFTLLHNHVYKDARRVYVGINALPVMGADAGSFIKLADLKHGAALFRDQADHFLYEPAYNEMYRLETKEAVVLISKPLWVDRTALNHDLAGTISAELSEGSLSSPVMKSDGEPAEPALLATERGKMKQLKSLFIEAAEAMRLP